MAEYVADNREIYITPLTGTYATDEANKILTLGSDGEGDTEFILPASQEWLLVEVYDVEATYGDLGYHKYTDRVDQVVITMETIRTIANAEYTLFKICAVHYNGDNTADVYRGDQATALTLDNTDTSFTPPVVSWKLSNDIITPLHKILICADSYECGMDWVCD